MVYLASINVLVVTLVRSIEQFSEFLAKQLSSQPHLFALIDTLSFKAVTRVCFKGGDPLVSEEFDVFQVKISREEITV
jgi:hypothetical protein